MCLSGTAEGAGPDATGAESGGKAEPGDTASEKGEEERVGGRRKTGKKDGKKDKTSKSFNEASVKEAKVTKVSSLVHHFSLLVFLFVSWLCMY